MDQHGPARKYSKQLKIQFALSNLSKTTANQVTQCCKVTKHHAHICQSSSKENLECFTLHFRKKALSSSHSIAIGSDGSE
jgi:hypothetical protein